MVAELRPEMLLAAMSGHSLTAALYRADRGACWHCTGRTYRGVPGRFTDAEALNSLHAEAEPPRRGGLHSRRYILGSGFRASDPPGGGSSRRRRRVHAW